MDGIGVEVVMEMRPPTLSFLVDILDIELGCISATPHGMVGCFGGSSAMMA